MRIDVVTLFPEMVRQAAGHGIQGRAISRGLLQLETWNPRDYSEDRHGAVDDRSYGGGPGMVMQVQPLRAAIRAARSAGVAAPVIYLSPQGRRFDQQKALQLAGLERPALVVLDAVTRLLPGALGDEDSAQNDSFMDVLLDYPHYTRPEEIDGKRVPDVLIGGNHKLIDRWRRKQALGRTWQRRPDLLEALQLDAEQQELLNEFINEHEQSE